MKKLLLLTVFAGAMGVAYADDTIHSFRTDKGKVEVFVGAANAVYIRTPVNVWYTGFERGSSGSCEFKKSASGKCYSQSEMIGEIESKTRSGDYWR